MSLLKIISSMRPQVTAPAVKPIVILYGMESNSGGEAHNSDALSSELTLNNNFLIWNNDTSVIEGMQVGVNNLLGHYGVSDPPTNGATLMHGWELQQSNRQKAGTLTPATGAPTILIKVGQGGTRAFHWMPGTDFTENTTTVVPWTILINRIDACLNAIDAAYGGCSAIYWMYTQGINDGTGGATSTWINYTETIMNNVRARYASRCQAGKIPIVMTKFFAPYNVFDSAIDQICSDLSDVYSVSGADLPPYDPAGNPHWPYAQMKTLSDRMWNMFQSHYTI